MTKRNFDQSDAKVLAEFVGLDYYYDGWAECIVVKADNRIKPMKWKPWNDNSSQWQIQSLKDAVREKGLEDEFETQLIKQVRDHGAIADFMDKFEAPPEAICSAILSMEVE